MAERDAVVDYSIESDAFLADLLEKDRWFVWAYDDDRKIPRAPWREDDHVDKYQSYKDESVWVGFEKADEWVGKVPQYEHASCIPNIDDNSIERLIFFDFDDCRDPSTGEIHGDVWAFIEEYDLAAFLSTSGTGLHGFGYGTLPDGYKPSFELALPEWEHGDDAELEVYASSRFLAQTGQHIESTPISAADLGETAHELFEEFGSEQSDGDDHEPSLDRDEIEDLDVTSDVSVIYDAIANVRPSDITIRSSVTTEHGSHRDVNKSLDPSWANSKSETRLAEFDDHWLYRKGNHNLDALQLVALEERIIRDASAYPQGDEFTDAVQALRERGAEIPEYEPAVMSTSPANTIGTEVEATDGGVAVLDESADEPSIDEAPDLDLNPTDLAVAANLGVDQTLADLNDRQKAAAVWSIIRQHDDVHVRCQRDNGSLWAYDTDTGTWSDDGERALRHAAVKALTRQQYGSNVLAELKAQARADIQAEIEHDDFGVDTGTVAVANGLLDLDAAAAGDGSDAIRDLQPDDYALSRLPVEFDPTAEYDEWSGYVDEWVESGYADALQEFVGYCLHVGSMPIHRALLLVGSGSNGKGTFLHVVRSLLGSDNTSSTELQTLANERDAVADMQGSLANIDDDLSSRGLGSGLGMFKKLVAGDPVRGRRLYEDGFEFEPSTKHLYAANQVPDVQVSDEDEAFWRRWLLVEFTNHYAPAERDSSLRDQLTTDDALSGVLRWAIEGRRRLLDQGHFTGELDLAYDKRRRWQQWGDTVDEFIEDCIEHDSDAERITTGDAYQVYQEWCRRSDDDPVGQRRFTDAVKTEGVGFGKHRIDGTVTNGYTALGFTDDAPDLEAVLADDGDDESSDSQNQAIDEFDDDGDDDDGGDQAAESGDDGGEVDDLEADDGDAEGGTEAGQSGEEQADNDDDDGGSWASALGVITTKVDDGAEIEPTDLADRTGKPELYWSNALDALADQSDAVERDGGGGYRRAG